ncbi:hypothetical protein [Arthrobacter sp. UYCu723]
MQKTPTQLLSDLLAALGGIPEDAANYRSVREATKLATDALALLTPTPTT